MTTTSTKRANTVDMIGDLLRDIASTQKRAAEMGETSHPTKNLEDGTMEASEGARSAENSKDVKEDQGPAGVESQSKGFPGGQDSVTLNIGVESAATGEDPSSETERADDGMKDPGGYLGETSHPAKLDKVANTARRVISLTKAAADLGAKVLSDMAQESKAANVANAPAPAKKAAACVGCSEDPCNCETKLASAHGNVPAFDKQAEAAVIVDGYVETIKTAYEAADRVASALIEINRSEKAAQNKNRTKKSDDDEGHEDSDDEDGGDSDSHEKEEKGNQPPSDGGEPPVDHGDPSGGDKGLLQAMSGGAPGGMGGDPMGGGAPPMPGGDPMAGGDPLAGLGGGAPGGAPPMPGGDPMAGGMPGGAPGGDPMAGGAPGGMPGAGGDPLAGLDPQTLQMLLAALQQAGVSPEQAEMAATAKQARAAKLYAQANKTAAWKPKTAEDARRVNEMAAYLKELCGR